MKNTLWKRNEIVVLFHNDTAGTVVSSPYLYTPVGAYSTDWLPSKIHPSEREKALQSWTSVSPEETKQILTELQGKENLFHQLTLGVHNTLPSST